MFVYGNDRGLYLNKRLKKHGLLLIPMLFIHDLVLSLKHNTYKIYTSISSWLDTMAALRGKLY